MSEYSPLLEMVRPYLNFKFDEIPENIKAYVKEADFFSKWDELTPWQREQLVDRYDCEHDPERAKAVDDACNRYLRKLYLEAEKTELELMSVRTPLERESKIRQLNELNKELDELESGRNGNNSKPERISVSLQQETAILNMLREKGYDPLSLPQPPRGKAGVKKEVRDNLVNTQLFISRKTFDDKWQQLLTEVKIKYKS